MPMTPKKAWKEEFSKFFEYPSREALRELLKFQVGEFDPYDFKASWPIFSKVARHFLALANSGGGCLIIGVKEREDRTFEPVGLPELMDKTSIHDGVQKFIPSKLRYEVLDFSYEESEYPKLVGKKFQVAVVEDSPEFIPFVAKTNGDDIRGNAIYTRRGTSSQEANYEDLQDIFNRRLETAHLSGNEFRIDRHLSELRSLYEYIPKHISPFEGLANLGLLGQKNPQYPKEGFYEFVSRLIEVKKKTIETLALRQ